MKLEFLLFLGWENEIWVIGSLGLGIKVTKMGMGNTSAITKTVMVGYFLSSIAKIKGMEGC